MAGRPINQDRQIAIELGLRTYTGTKHVKCDTTERYVAGGGCVHCGRLKATEQREALIYLRSQQQPLDSGLAHGLDADDAEARRQADIDELM